MRLAACLVLFAAPVWAAPPAVQEELAGSLVIVGGGGRPPSVLNEFFRLAGGKDKAKIVVVPTASAAADRPSQADSFTRDWKDLGPASVVLLHTRDRKTADSAEFVKPLTEATAVWFSGGDQNKIIEVYADTLVENKIKLLLKRGGVVGGTSAGAAIMSDPMIQGGTGTAQTGRGFGFLPGVVVDQHFSQRERVGRLRGVLDNYPGYPGLGIDEATAAVVTGRTVTVVGNNTVTAMLPKTATRPAREDVLKPGDKLDLFQLRRAALARAATPPFPVKDPPAPVVQSGTLVIAGGGALVPEILERFFAAAGGKDSPIVFVPTASEAAVIPDDPAEAKMLRRAGATKVSVLHTRDRQRADEPSFSEVLTKAKGVWFGGGRQWRFVDAYEGTLTEKRFHEVLARGGAIGGTSAGASIQGELMPRGHPLGNTVMAAEGYERGFGFLPGAAIDQHFFARKRTADMTGLMKQYPNWLGIGIDEATAVVVIGHTAEVVGKSKAAFYDYRAGPPAGEVDYTEVPAGGRYDLKARAVVK